MKLSGRSSLANVAACVAQAMARARIKAVLTGGACASLYSRGAFESSDLDFVLQSAVTARTLDSVMHSIGFGREGNQYRHPTAPFFVEFPAGPLGIGTDLKIEPVLLRVGRVSVRALSATDSCRDRLAGFYHWRDRQSLLSAVAIASRRRVNMQAIRRWSEGEAALERFEEFSALVRRARKSGGKGRSLRPRA